MLISENIFPDINLQIFYIGHQTQFVDYCLKILNGFQGFLIEVPDFH